MSTERTIAANLKLYYDYHAPDEESGARPLLIALHGYGSNKKWMMREALKFTPPEFAIVALQGFHQHLKEPRQPGEPLRYGFGWLTNFHPEDSIDVHHRALLDLIDAFANEGFIDRRRVFLLGFSQPVGVNYRFAFTYPDVLRGIIGICGGLPGDWETSEAYQSTGAAVLHLAGTNDEFYPPSRVSNYEAQLGRRAHELTVKSYEAGHELTPEMGEDIKTWLGIQAAKSNP